MPKSVELKFWVFKILLYPLHFFKSITQVIELLDRVRSCKLPFLCERIIEVTHRSWSVLPAKLKHYKSSQMVETQENIEELPPNEYEEIHIQHEAVLKENEYNGKDFAADEIPYYCTLIIQCRKRQYFCLSQLKIGKVLDSLDLVRFKEDY